MQILKVKNLNVKIGRAPILEDINFEVNRGEIVAIIGPNGAGKTTLFKALLDLIPYEGKIIWKPKLKIGYVPQRLDIDIDLPLTVKEFFNLRDSKISDAKITEALDYIQLDNSVLEKGLGEISVGQRQRLLVGWSILDNPEVLLFDEPTADVDVYGQESIYKMISHLQKKFQMTVILISHDLNIIYKYSNKVLCLNHRNLCFGSPELMLEPNRLKDLFGEEKGFYHHDHKH
ncbi:MAG: metal ABC transporter ATP-binding protein [Patescibacteria group bacterium]|nr:metal ABC transporter ATP-binding protein [Patescibacteria group bacterium]